MNSSHGFSITASRINRKLACLILISSFAFAIISIGVNFWIAYKHELQVKSQALSHIEKSMLGSIGKSLWYLDDMLLKQNAEGVLATMDIISVSIRDHAGTEHVHTVKDGLSSEITSSAYDVSYPLTRDSESGREQIGSLIIKITNYYFYQRLKEKILIGLLIESLKIFLLSILIMAFVQLVVTSAVSQISNFFKRGLGGLKDSSALVVVRRLHFGHDELDEFVEEYNKLAEQNKIAKLRLTDELTQKEQALNALSRMASLGELAGNLGHEINNPLAILFGYANKIRRTGDKSTDPVLRAEILDLAEKVSKLCHRIQSTTKGLSVLARTSDAEERKTEEIGIMLDEVLALVTEKARSAGIKISSQVDDPRFQISCNRIMIGQVLINLLNNSFHAIKKFENPWVKIETACSENAIIIRIIDCGLGISNEVCKNVFLPFFTTKPVGEGTGLGLSVALKIIKAHGGDLKINENNPNTTFEILLPRAPMESAVKAA